ncbi:unnamed protein product [Zymoseptoria tritici ST99CH_3D7]|uniref:Uncharacterized protein n=1 Tax=Zymoseptoria tritici (strain ST99CH_3D7) TaxID=1276538 RepID=A0A1X7S4R4_ZYMT9|nr:unnamed protein product [Zymoseptoria tritici ST99CH_3D7]
MYDIDPKTFILSSSIARLPAGVTGNRRSKLQCRTAATWQCERRKSNTHHNQHASNNTASSDDDNIKINMKNIIFLASTLLFALGTIAAPAAEAEALGRIPVPPYCYEECTSGSRIQCCDCRMAHGHPTIGC